MKKKNFDISDIQIKCEKAIVAYCDVTGFMNWSQQSADLPEDSKQFIVRMKYEFLKFRLRTGYFVLNTGDGMIVIINSVWNSNSLLKVISELVELIRAMDLMIKKTPYPRPEGFRIRITVGPVFRTETPHPLYPHQREIDFTGRPINLGQRLLEIERQIKIMLHASAADVLNPANRKKLKKVMSENPPPKGVTEGEMRGGLWEYPLKSMR